MSAKLSRTGFLIFTSGVFTELILTGNHYGTEPVILILSGEQQVVVIVSDFPPISFHTANSGL